MRRGWPAAIKTLVPFYAPIHDRLRAASSVPPGATLLVLPIRAVARSPSTVGNDL
jgi:hypothetical protein